MSGKGSNSRPFEVPREEFEASFDRIFGKRERKPWTYKPDEFKENDTEVFLKDGEGDTIG